VSTAVVTAADDVSVVATGVFSAVVTGVLASAAAVINVIVSVVVLATRTCREVDGTQIKYKLSLYKAVLVALWCNC